MHAWDATGGPERRVPAIAQLAKCVLLHTKSLLAARAEHNRRSCALPNGLTASSSPKRPRSPAPAARTSASSDALLHQADLSDARLPHLELRNCSCAPANLANLQARGATLERVAIESGRLTGVRLVEARLTDVLISGCRVDLASFGGTRMERVTFEDCQMAQTDFLEATLDGVRFHGCDLRAVDFRGARLRNTEFRRCELSELLGVESLRGASLEWETIVGMADVWAAALGIKVLPETSQGDPSGL